LDVGQLFPAFEEGPVKDKWQYVLRERTYDVTEEVEEDNYIRDEVGDDVDKERDEESLRDGCEI
jgi:hypothetical protein